MIVRIMSRIQRDLKLKKKKDQRKNRKEKLNFKKNKKKNLSIKKIPMRKMSSLKIYKNNKFSKFNNLV